MKKLFLVLTVAGTIGLSSCAKDYSCVCTDDATGNTTDVFYSDLKGDAKEAAEASCEVSNGIAGQTCRFINAD